MSTGPLVSIVTPCLNAGEWLSRCLDSVAAQTYPNIEHLVIDGGSTDGTIDLLRERGIQFVSEPDGGQTAALNKGFARARGDWLGWLNADDILLPRATEFAIAATESRPAAGWVYGDCDIRQDGARHLFVRPSASVDLRTIVAGNCIPQQGSLVARWAFERIGPLDEDFHLAMDYDQWVRLLAAGVPSVYVPETLAIFELHEASKSVSIHRSEFIFEEAVSLLKRGWGASAARTLGRAAVVAARSEVDRFAQPRLDDEIERFAGRARRYATAINVRRIRSFAYAEAALIELYANPRGFHYLLRPEPWLVRETRARLAAALARSVLRRIRAL